MPFSRFFVYNPRTGTGSRIPSTSLVRLKMPTFERVMEAPKHHDGLYFVPKM